MIKLNSKKKTSLIVAAVVASLAIVSVAAFAMPATAAEGLGSQVYMRARGIAISKVENETVRLPVNMTLTLNLGSRHGPITPIKAANGTVYIGNTQYNITNGKGVIIHKRHAALLRIAGLVEGGQQIVIKLKARYFWILGHLYAVRAKGISITEDSQMKLLIRAMAVTS